LTNDARERGVILEIFRNQLFLIQTKC